MPDPFNPATGAFARNIRALVNDDLSELVESMRAHGWVSEFPALRDENGVVLVGNRRLKAAAIAGVEPVIKTLTLGSGSAADAQRLRLAIVSNIGARPLSKEDRQRIAEHLYGEREWTMQRIAAALNVTHKTISKDLDGFVPEVQITPRAKTAANPRGAGRPKAALRTVNATDGLRPRVAPQRNRGRAIIRSIIEAGEPLNLTKLAEEHAISPDSLERAAAIERGRVEGMQEAEIAAPINPLNLNESQRAKFAALEQRLRAQIAREASKQRRQLEAEFDQRRRAEMQRVIEDSVLPAYHREIEQLRILLRSRRGVMPRAKFNKIRNCLHSDRVTDPTLKRRYDEAFSIFMSYELMLISEEEMPLPPTAMPRDFTEMMAMRARTQAAKAEQARRRKQHRDTPAA